MHITGHIAPHQKTSKKLPIYQIVNQNGIEMVCATNRSAILAIRTPDMEGTPLAMLHNDQENIAAYNKTTAVPGDVMGPVAFLYTAKSVEIGKKTRSLPGAQERKRFRSLLWDTTIRSTEHACTVTYRSASPQSKEANLPALDRSSHTIEVELNAHNQLRTRYTSKSDSKELFSLGHNLVWNIGRGNGLLRQRLIVNGDRIAHKPFSTALQPVRGSKKDYRTPRAITAECEGYYQINSKNTTNPWEHFGLPMEQPREQSAGRASGRASGRAADRLAPAIMLSESGTGRYVQIYTDYPCVHVALHHHAQKKGLGISFTPCILLDTPELSARRNARHTFHCCYSFGTIQRH